MSTTPSPGPSTNFTAQERMGLSEPFYDKYEDAAEWVAKASEWRDLCSSFADHAEDKEGEPSKQDLTVGSDRCCALVDKIFDLDRQYGTGDDDPTALYTERKYVDEEMKRLKLHFAMLSETTGKDGRQAASAGWKSEKALNRKKRLHGQPGSATEDQTNDEQSQLSAAEGTQ